MENYLRKATWEDGPFLFELVNDPLCRKSSLQTGEVSKEIHERWLFKQLYRKDSFLYIFCNANGEAIGQGRLDLEKEGVKISYSISPNCRKQGLGTQLIAKLEEKAIELEEEKVIAFVKYENDASRRIFQKLGFKEEEQSLYVKYSKNVREK